MTELSEESKAAMASYSYKDKVFTHVIKLCEGDHDGVTFILNGEPRPHIDGLSILPKEIVMPDNCRYEKTGFSVGPSWGSTGQALEPVSSAIVWFYDFVS